MNEGLIGALRDGANALSYRIDHGDSWGVEDDVRWGAAAVMLRGLADDLQALHPDAWKCLIGAAGLSDAERRRVRRIADGLNPEAHDASE